MSKISLLNTQPSSHIPSRHRELLKFCFDPYRQKRAGWSNTRNNGLVFDYGSTTKKGPNLMKPNGSGCGLLEYSYQAAGPRSGIFTRTSDSNPNIRIYQAAVVDKVYSLRFEARSDDSTYAPSLGPFNADYVHNDYKNMSSDWQTFEMQWSSDGSATIYLYLAGASGNSVEVRNMQLHTFEGNVGITQGDLEETGWDTHAAGMYFTTNDCINYPKQVHDNSANDPVLITWWQKDQNGPWIIDNDYGNFEVGVNANYYVGYVGTDTDPYYKAMADYLIPHGCTASQWNHYGVAINYTGNKIRFYANGSLVQDYTHTGSNLDVSRQTYLMCLGARNSTTQFVTANLGISSIYWFTDGSVPADIDTLISETYTLQQSIYGV